jgi:hypothetical protein
MHAGLEPASCMEGELAIALHANADAGHTCLAAPTCSAGPALCMPNSRNVARLALVALEGRDGASEVPAIPTKEGKGCVQLEGCLHAVLSTCM